jgi:hypothetical protein
VLVIADSLCFHGPNKPELLTHPDLFPNRLGTELTERLGRPVEVDTVTKFGMTARDAWWAMTKDPRVYSILLRDASAVVLAVGNMDQLPAAIPTYLRSGIDYIRPDWLRHRVAAAFHKAHPRIVKLHGARLRVLPQKVTDSYIEMCVNGVRHYHPGAVVVGNVPPRHASDYYAQATHGHAPAQLAMRNLAARLDLPVVELEPIVGPNRDAGRNNPDGMHWGWETHAEVGKAYADVLAPLLRSAPPRDV